MKSDLEDDPDHIQITYSSFRMRVGVWGDGRVHDHFRDPEKDTNNHCFIYLDFLDKE